MTTNRKKTGRDHSFLFETSTRYCTNHQGTANAAGGEWLITGNGRLRRWICAACNERRMERFSMGRGGIPAVQTEPVQPAPPNSLAL